MQPKIQLQEVIWEITNKCNKNCSYCGSKHIINKSNENDMKENNIINNITNRLIEYSEKCNKLEVNLSGGEPSTIEYELMNHVVNSLKSAGNKVKIITNGNLFTNANYNGEVDYNLLLNEFDAIGLSINTEQDISDLAKYTNQITIGIADKITIITNFGSHNIWLFDKIADTINNNFASSYWQIQLTEGEYLLPPEGIKYLYSKIDKQASPHIVYGDNLKHDIICQAGIKSCGITYDGYMIPCLSMRSWSNNYMEDNYLSKDFTYNILANPIIDVWQNEFKLCRFCEHPNCKTNIIYPDVVSRPIKIIQNDPDTDTEQIKPKNNQVVVVYGVYIPNNEDKYPIDNTQRNVFVYGVYSPTNKPYTSYIYDGLDNNTLNKDNID